MSADGQMIINTGLLPITEGAVCFSYPDNCFPSLSEQYDNAALIQSDDMSVWNQGRMSDAYGIDENIACIGGADSEVFSLLLEKYDDFQFMMTLTRASHTPFTSFSEECPLRFNKEMPKTMRNYLNCVHYTDSCLGEFLHRVDTDERLKSSTIVITGDHTIFDEQTREQFWKYCDSFNESYTVRDAYCPLIIYSPSITGKIITDEVNYQMDIYPTILHLIGRDGTYYWKGFGKNLLSDEVRRITPEEAFILSEKMINADYSRTITGDRKIRHGSVTLVNSK